MNFIADKLEYWITNSESSDYVVVFQDKSIAHQFKLSLTLGSVHGPWDEPRDYTLLRKESDQCFVEIKKVTIKSEDWRDDACCQSGCPGCAWTEAQEKL